MVHAIAPLALTMGEPAGIGGEIALLAWAALRGTGPVFFAIDDPARLAAIAARHGWAVPVRTIARPEDALETFPHALPVLPLGRPVAAAPGRPDPALAGAVVASIERAVALALANRAAGVVTNPIAKSAMYAAGFGFPGHTEMIGALTGTPRPVMMLAGPSLRVVPVTVHLPLRRALDALDQASIEHAARVADAALRRDFGIAAPRLAVAGLNPHAGEDGALGDEETTTIAPAIAALRAAGLDATGPHPPDTLFAAHARRGYDAAICMYHDQALIPLKALEMESGVNVTLGPPIIRTSPDHGTAFDLAGTGQADPGSLVAALRLGAEMAARRAVRPQETTP